MAWVMRRKDVKSGWYVCFRTADGREVRRAAGKSRRSAERIKAKIETQLREGKFFEREARFYEPTDRGLEQRIAEKMAHWRALDAASDWQRYGARPGPGRKGGGK